MIEPGAGIDTLLTAEAVAGLALAVLAAGLLLLAIWRRESRPLRPRSLDALAAAAAAARRAGAVPVTPLGRGNLAGMQSADSLAALAAAGAGPTSTRDLVAVAGDATLWVAARQRHAGATFVGPDAATFAAGVRELLADPSRATLAWPAEEGASVPSGAFGDEFLLFAEPQVLRDGPRDAAAVAAPTVLPFVLLTAEQPAVGAELYQVDAALGSRHARPTEPVQTWLYLALPVSILALALLFLVAGR